LRNRPIFEGDRGHIHHKLLDRGFTHKGSVLLMYGVCGLGAAVSLLVSAFHNQFGGLIVILFCVAACVGVQSLGYGEFTMAGEMFFKGKFRRIIDTETRLLDLEAALASAVELEDCWTIILKSSKEFGFHSVRFNVAGQIFEDLHRNPGPEWQIRIPLSESQYINFYRDFESEVNPLILSAFVSTIEQGVKGILGRSQPQRILPQTAGMVYTSAAQAS